MSVRREGWRLRDNIDPAIPVVLLITVTVPTARHRLRSRTVCLIRVAVQLLLALDNTEHQT